MNALIGNTGLIGKHLKTCWSFSHEYNSSNIAEISNYKFDTVYIAAPTGNRLQANDNPEKDLNNIKYLLDHLIKTSIRRVVLIGTVDSILRNNLPYGQNRLWLENQINNKFELSYTIRLSALVHKNITKNILYDLKHKLYLDKINLNTEIQWYDLNNLTTDINRAIKNDLRECNLVSEPISNKEICNQFFPGLTISATPVVNQTISPYVYTKTDIFQSMKDYLDA